MINRLLDITNQLLDLGKRNRLLNFKDTGLKTLKILNKNMEEIFRGITNSREYTIFNTDPILSKYSREFSKSKEEDEFNYLDSKVYDICSQLVGRDEFLCYKRGYSMDKTLKALSKEYKTSISEKGINSLYITYGFVHYVEEEIEYIAPLLLVPVELDNETGPYIVREYEDEVLVNPTLKYYFSSAYQVEFPDYNHDAISTYFAKVRALLPEGITLDDGMALGIYSFFKMNMYNDLMSNKDMVINNKNIRILLGERANDDEIKPMPIYPVVNYDSSQLEAIQNAADGKSFCLQGPPGSGKSQTITNIIASLLGSGKKILFVSEKIAALRVVFENLRRAGLSDFAIELHSNKTNKKEFIDNLYNTATLPKYDIDFKTKFIGSEYSVLSNDLKSYEDEIHQTIPSLGISLLDLYSEYLKIDFELLDVNLDLEGLNLYDMEKMVNLLNEYSRQSKLLGYDYRKNPLYALNQLGDSYIAYEFEEELDSAVKQLVLMQDIEELLKKCNNAINNILDGTEAFYLVEKLTRIKTFNPNYLIKKNREKLIEAIESYLKINSTLDAKIFESYKSSIINENLEALQAQLRNPGGLIKNKGYKDAYSKLANYRNKKASAEVLISELEVLIKVKRDIVMATTHSNFISKVLGDIKNLNLKNVLVDLRILDGSKDFLVTKELYLEIVEKFKNRFSRFEIDKKDNINLIKLAKRFNLERFNIYKESIPNCYDRVIAILGKKKEITTVMRWIKGVEEISKCRAIEYLDRFLDLNLNIDELAAGYEKLFYKYMIDEVIDSSKLLSEFKAQNKNMVIKDFIELDEKKLSVNRDNIIVLNSQKRPDEKVIEGSMFKILSHEHSKSRRHMPIRGLLEQIFELALDIKPVFLMSPLSVSTYLASKLNMFVCVIFDEASQIFASDALGSIYRAKQCIVIGDTKQMPPSNFFQAGVDDFSEKEYDLESVLDKASQSFDTLSLKWHYRSRNEELITFSNQSFYDSNLITIPQSRKHEVGFGIDFYYVQDGLYDTKSRTNLVEANKVCDMVFEHLKNSDESLGVVAFSNVQAELISELIEKRLKKNPLESKYFPTDIDEPFFVKNLESVQGDERDRIIFSICYGYNSEGKFHQRFGPLNNLGGERRLNVAITRAKFNVSIVSSIKHSDINTHNTESQGVLLLKSYLEFAENVTTDKRFNESDNGIIKAVKEYIESLGYEVYPNYGLSSFKIDLAIKKDEEFILALMIDGSSSYTSNLTDKYRLERLLLERQGWRYFKLYSTAWFNDIELEKKRLYEALTAEYVPYEERKVKATSFLREDRSDSSLDAEFNEYLELDNELGKDYYESKGMEALVTALIKREQPVHEDYLYKRISTILDKPRVTPQLKDEINEGINKLIIKAGDYYFVDPSLRIRLRYNSNREVPHIHPEEYYDGVYTVVNKHNGITIDGCYKTIATLLGFDKVIPNLRKMLDDAADKLILEGKIEKRKDSFYNL